MYQDYQQYKWVHDWQVYQVNISHYQVYQLSVSSIYQHSEDIWSTNLINALCCVLFCKCSNLYCEPTKISFTITSTYFVSCQHALQIE